MTDERILDAVADEAGWMEDLLVRLIEAPTTLGAEDRGQEVMASAFADCGLEPTDVPLDAAALQAAEGSSPFSWDVAGKRNVVARWDADGGGRSLILCGHVDVVPPAAEHLWSHRPFQAVRDGDWMYGRGAGDMKAGLAAMTGAVRALRGLGIRLEGPVELQSVVEEECMGFNAFDAAHAVLRALRELESELNREPPPPFDGFEHPINLNAGVMAGGDWPSTVAASCTLSCRLALYPGDDPADLQRRVEESVAAAAQAAGGRARVRYDGFACEGAAVDPGETVVTELARAYARVLDSAPALVPTTATTDARHFIRSGIPAVCFGPRAERIHGIDERVSLRSMVETAQVLALFVRTWCNRGEER